MPRCDACAVDLSPAVYSRHLERDHKLDLCRVCSRPVLKCVITPAGNSPSFCSSSCVEEFRRRGTCFNCLKSPVAGADTSFCTVCRTTYRASRAQADRVTQEIRAIERAERLPEVYQRRRSGPWHDGPLDDSEEVA